MRAPFQGTLPAVFAARVVHEAERRGISRARLLAGAGLAEASLASPEALMPIASVFAVYEAAMRVLRDDGLPIAIARTFALEDIRRRIAAAHLVVVGLEFDEHVQVLQDSVADAESGRPRHADLSAGGTLLRRQEQSAGLVQIEPWPGDTSKAKRATL